MPPGSRPPALPFAGDYAERHKAFLNAVFTEPTLLEPFAHGGQLPADYGVGLDERVVEYPWLLASRLRGRVLDAGSALNHEHLLDRFLPEVESLTIVTLEPEAAAFTERRISYVYGDLRDLPFREAWFDTIVSLYRLLSTWVWTTPPTVLGLWWPCPASRKWQEFGLV